LISGRGTGRGVEGLRTGRRGGECGGRLHTPNEVHKSRNKISFKKKKNDQVGEDHLLRLMLRISRCRTSTMAKTHTDGGHLVSDDTA
jgi:hypothetical protein